MKDSIRWIIVSLGSLGMCINLRRIVRVTEATGLIQSYHGKYGVPFCATTFDLSNLFRSSRSPSTNVVS